MPHTPGPWHKGQGNGEGSIFAESGRMRMESGGTTLYPICAMNRGWKEEEDEANANLIAAAPEMLTALEECVTDDDARAMTDESRNAASIARDRLEAINKVIRAAIAKARGQ